MPFFFAVFFFVAMAYFSAVMNFTHARNCERIGASEAREADKANSVDVPH